MLHRTLGPIIGDEEVTAEMVSGLATDGSTFATKEDILEVRLEIQAATNRMLLWYIGVSTTQLGITLGFIAAVR